MGVDLIEKKESRGGKLYSWETRKEKGKPQGAATATAAGIRAEMGFFRPDQTGTGQVNSIGKSNFRTRLSLKDNGPEPIEEKGGTASMLSEINQKNLWGQKVRQIHANTKQLNPICGLHI